ncbi:MAG TPA: DsbA family protein [Acidimicrobiales bacterium]|nr:DsbA family protein [Acidimicrobiales bacterium]
MAITELAGGPHDVEYFFDPGCPFAWQTSVWMRRVAALRDVRIGWRFISLRFVNESNADQPDEMREAQEVGLRFHRVCAAARERFGNDAVGALYRAWGERYWYSPASGEMLDRVAAAARRIDAANVVAAAGLPADLVEAADDASFDDVIRAETDEAFRRTGEGVGTPIITYLPGGNSLFGPVMSEVPDDDRAVRMYEALRTFADFDGFSELKRTQRPPLDLPLFKAA